MDERFSLDQHNERGVSACKGRAHFRLVRHGIIPVLGTLLIVGIFVLLLISPAAPPLNLIPYILLIWVLIGVGIIFALRRKIA